MRILVALLVLISLAAGPVMSQDRFWVEAAGVAPMSKDMTATRRLALAEALLVASMAGGTEVRGYTQMDKARIVADRYAMRPTGQVLRHEIIQEGRNGGYYQVKVKALVGPLDPKFCDEYQSLTVTGFPAQIDIDPTVPAWLAALGQNVVHDFYTQIDAYPRVTLEQVSHVPEHRMLSPDRAKFDYMSLTRGSAARLSPSDHGFYPKLRMITYKGSSGETVVQAVVHIRMTQNGRPAYEHQYKVDVVSAHHTAIDRLTGSKRRRAEQNLKAGITDKFRSMLDKITCRPPSAALQVAGDTISIDLGAKHGLTKNSLGFIASSSRTLEAFEVVSLSSKSAKLRAISPQRSLRSYNGVKVHFLKAGF